jgi:DNA polymerase V
VDSAARGVRYIAHGAQFPLLNHRRSYTVQKYSAICRPMQLAPFRQAGAKTMISTDLSALPTLGAVVLSLDAARERFEFPYSAIKCPAGFPSPAADYIQDGLDFNDYLVHHKAATFVFDVSGYSMMGAGIYDGDKIVVDRSVSARHGHIVVAVVDGQHTVKRLFMDGDRVELHPENQDYPIIEIREGEELTIFGVVVGVVRKLRM